MSSLFHSQELKLKDEECQKLSRIQDQLNNEVEELTAKLFEEANNMVQDAHVKRMHAEKLLKEANSKVRFCSTNPLPNALLVKQGMECKTQIRCTQKGG